MTEYWKKQMEHELTKGYHDKLVQLIKLYKPESVLELGTGWGISGSAFLDNGVERLVTIDASNNPAYLDTAREEMETHRKPGQEVVYVLSTTAEYFAANNEKFDLVFVDADHAFGPAYADLLGAVERLNPGGKIIMDDYLHEANFVFDSRNCGVSKAARQYLIDTGRQAIVVPHNKENGFLVI